MVSIKPNIQIKIAKESSTYIPGKGTTVTEKCVTNNIFGSESDIFYCEWRGNFGSDVMLAEAQNIKDLSTIRMNYHPDVYFALQDETVKIYRNEEPAPFTVYGAVDNINLENRILEFKVKRIVAK